MKSERYFPRLFFVGQHNKPGLTPLCSSTYTGAIVDQIIQGLNYPLILTYKTNLCEVEYLPKSLDEILEFNRLWKERYSPGRSSMIVLLGDWVQKNFQFRGERILKIPHPGGLRFYTSKARYIEKSVDLIQATIRLT